MCTLICFNFLTVLLYSIKHKWYSITVSNFTCTISLGNFNVMCQPFVDQYANSCDGGKASVLEVYAFLCCSDFKEQRTCIKCCLKLKPITCLWNHLKSQSTEFCSTNTLRMVISLLTISVQDEHLSTQKTLQKCERQLLTNNPWCLHDHRNVVRVCATHLVRQHYDKRTLLQSLYKASWAEPKGTSHGWLSALNCNCSKRWLQLHLQCHKW